MAAERRNVLTLNKKPNMTAVGKETAPISSKAAACLSLFDRCIAMAASVDAQRQSSIEDQIARLSIWTFNMAVFAKSKLSLDHRLRWTPQVRDLVTGLLGVLEDYIQQLLSLLERLGDSELSIPDRNQLLAGGDFERALLTIGNELTLLNELSNTIRKASRKTQDEKALSEFTIRDEGGNNLEGVLQDAWADNLLDRFPGCSETIRTRLAKVMVLRRKRILYRRSRYSGDPFRKLQTTDKPTLRPLPVPNRTEAQDQQQLRRRETGFKVSGESPSMIASTAIRSATTLALPDFQQAQTPSVVSKSRTIALDSHQELAFPHPPGKFGRKHFANLSAGLGGKMEQFQDEYAVEEVCPFCLFILSSKDISSEQKWREHVTGDLEAYVCLFEECDEPERMWTHSETWLKHMRQHALQWRCPAKSHRGQTFVTQQDFQNHLEQDHKKKYTDAELALVINRSRQSTGPLFTSCPLCGEEVQQSGGKLEKHIVGHLRSLALKSLPPVYDEEDDEDEDNTKRSDGAISNRSTVKGVSDMSSQGTFQSVGELSLSPYEPADLHLEGVSDQPRSASRPTFHIRAPSNTSTGTEARPTGASDGDANVDSSAEFDIFEPVERPWEEPLVYNNAVETDDAFVLTGSAVDAPTDATGLHSPKNEVLCPLLNRDGSSCRKIFTGEKRYRAIQEHIRRAHPEYYISKLPATEESFLLMVNTPSMKPLAPEPPHTLDEIFVKQEENDDKEAESILSNKHLFSFGDEDDKELFCSICKSKSYPGPPPVEGPDVDWFRGHVFTDDTEFSILCDNCGRWQHGACVGIFEEEKTPEEYFCEQCRPRCHEIHTARNGQQWSKYVPDKSYCTVPGCLEIHTKHHHAPPAIPKREAPTKASSYWSVAESNDFPRLLRSFGNDWKAIAAHMGTKTAVMVKNYYVRQIGRDKPEWESIVQEAEIKKEKDEKLPDPPHPPWLGRRYDTSAATSRPVLLPMEPAVLGPVFLNSINASDFKIDSGPFQPRGRPVSSQQGPSSGLINEHYGSTISQAGKLVQTPAAVPHAPDHRRGGFSIKYLINNDPPPLKRVVNTMDMTWRGSVSMNNVAFFEATARHIGGASLQTVGAWNHLTIDKLIPMTLAVVGHTSSRSTDDYLCSLRYSSNTDVVVAEIIPVGRSSAIGCYHLIDHLIQRSRCGVVDDKSTDIGKHIYLVPVLPGEDTIPAFMKELETNHIPNSRSAPILLGVFVYNSKEAKEAAEEVMEENAEEDREGDIEDDFDLEAELEKVLAEDPDVGSNLSRVSSVSLEG